jgi:hypothetical protein
MNRLLYTCISIIILFSSIMAGNNPTIDSINQKVKSIDDSISKGGFQTLEFNETTISEGSPPAIIFFFKRETVEAVKVSVGHEAWVIVHWYYFYPDGNLMKYLKIIDGRPDNPPKLGIIMGNNKQVLWKNTVEMPAQPNDFIELFKKSQAIRMAFKGY